MPRLERQPTRLCGLKTRFCSTSLPAPAELPQRQCPGPCPDRPPGPHAAEPVGPPPGGVPAGARGEPQVGAEPGERWAGPAAPNTVSLGRKVSQTIWGNRSRPLTCPGHPLVTSPPRGGAGGSCSWAMPLRPSSLSAPWAVCPSSAWAAGRAAVCGFPGPRWRAGAGEQEECLSWF